MLNGINELATRSDLLDRSILLNLPVIPPGARKEEKQLWAEYEHARPRLLGALCDAVSTALARQQKVVRKDLPRMADFAIWATAAEPALGINNGEFMAAYTGNRAAANDLALDASAVWPVLHPLLDLEEYEGTAADLLSRLESKADQRTRERKGWPGTAAVLSKQLKRLAPNLRAAGWEYETRDGNPRRLTLRHCGNCAKSQPHPGGKEE